MTSILSRNSSRFFIRRAIQSLLLILILIAVNFLLIHVAPGDPVHMLAGQSGDEKYYEFIRAKFGLDQPLTTQLWIYLSRDTLADAERDFVINYRWRGAGSGSRTPGEFIH